MMFRTWFLLLFLGITLSLTAESPGSAANSVLSRQALSSARTAFLRHLILAREPVIPEESLPAFVPFWPDVKFYLSQAADFGHSGLLLKGLVALHEADLEDAKSPLERVWSEKSWQAFGELTAAQAYFTSLTWQRQDIRLQSAWKLWPDKYLSPPSLLLGIQSYERTQPTIAQALLKQAFELYPEDRRFLGEMTLFASQFPQTLPLWQNALQQNLRWSHQSQQNLLLRVAELTGGAKQNSHDVLQQAGFEEQSFKILEKDYTVQSEKWLQNGVKSVPQGIYTWSQGRTGNWMTLQYQKGELVSWSSCMPGTTLWLARFTQGQLSQITEYMGSESWELTYLKYPFVKSLIWRSGPQVVEYTFLPFVTKAEPIPRTLEKIPEALWPALLLKAWKPLDPSVLIPQATRVYESRHQLLERVLCLVHGQVWLEIADENQDGQPDTWKYYRNGTLASVYQSFEGHSRPDLHEIYEQGKLAAVEADPHRKGRTEYVLYPQEGVALWDWKGTGTPLIRVFRWNGKAGLKATVFSHSEEPFQTMPVWDAPPWY